MKIILWMVSRYIEAGMKRRENPNETNETNRSSRANKEQRNMELKTGPWRQLQATTTEAQRFKYTDKQAKQDNKGAGKHLERLIN